jgi:hypothetical protein
MAMRLGDPVVRRLLGLSWVTNISGAVLAQESDLASSRLVFHRRPIALANEFIRCEIFSSCFTQRSDATLRSDSSSTNCNALRRRRRKR